MNVPILYENLKTQYGPRCDPSTWWPIFYGQTTPPEFERVITNVLVQNSTWKTVPRAVDHLYRGNLLTAHALATASPEAIAEAIKPTGLQSQKASRLKKLCGVVVDRFGGEAPFCKNVTRQELLGIQGIGPETADRILLYACCRMAWPVDSYCLRVFVHHGLLKAFPRTPSERQQCSVTIKGLVAEGMPKEVQAWQRLHALMQLEGETIRAKA